MTDRIKLMVDGVWQSITVAYTSRAWAALGYRSWDDYCTREFRRLICACRVKSDLRSFPQCASEA